MYLERPLVAWCGQGLGVGAEGLWSWRPGVGAEGLWDLVWSAAGGSGVRGAGVGAEGLRVRIYESCVMSWW